MSRFSPYFFILYTFFIVKGYSQAPVTKAQEALFKKTCYTIAGAFAKADFKTLNKYACPSGIYVITRPGAIDALNRYDSLEAGTFPYYPYRDKPIIKKNTPLKKGAAPRFDCGTEKWDKKGFFADTVRSTRISSLMQFLKENEMGEYSAEEIAHVKEMQPKARKVVFTEMANRHGLVFNLVLINNKWYLLLVDTVASDCGA